jgi:cytochrome c biogenesis protein
MKNAGKKAQLLQQNFCLLLKYFKSMQCGILLILIFVASAVYGSLLPHTEALNKVYNSWWFFSIFGLVALNLLACTLNRLRELSKDFRIFKSIQNGNSSSEFSDYPFRFDLEISGDLLHSVQNYAAVLLKKSSYRTQKVKFPRGETLLAAKGQLGIYGSLITHFSLLIIMASAYYGITTGSEDLVQIFPGEEVPVSIREEPFLLELIAFNIDFREDGSISQYYSELHLRPRDSSNAAAVRETVHVNNPLRYGGKVFYQSSYGWGVETSLHHPLSGSRELIILIPGQQYYFEPAGITLHMLSFYPNLVHGEEGELLSATPEPLNPHVLFSLLGQESQAPVSTASLKPVGQTTELPQFELTFTGFYNFSGILISENTAKIYILLGSISLLGGLFLSFFIQPRRILLSWHPSTAEESQLTVYGWSRSDRPAFAVEFYEFVDTLVKGERGL